MFHPGFLIHPRISGLCLTLRPMRYRCSMKCFRTVPQHVDGGRSRFRHGSRGPEAATAPAEST